MLRVIRNIVQGETALSIVLVIEQRFLYLIGDPEHPQDVFEKLANTFHRRSWVNKLRLRKTFYGYKLAIGGSVHEHLKVFVEIFNELHILGDDLEAEDKVIHLLASLPST